MLWGIDWRVEIDRARLRLGDTVTLQGNLDPAAVIAGVDAAVSGTREVLARNAGHPGTHLQSRPWGATNE